MGVEDNVSKQLKPLFENPPEWALPQEQKDEIYKAQTKFKGLAEKRPLPEDYSTTIGMPWRHVYGKGGNLIGGTQSAFLAHKGEQVGEVRWNPLTGHVQWLGVDPEHRITGTHHLINAAHEWAAKEGGLGPIQSDSLSEHSASIMKRFVPASIPSGTYLPTRSNRPYDNPNMQAPSIQEIGGRRLRLSLREVHYSLGYAQGALENAYSGPNSRDIPAGHPANDTVAHISGIKDAMQHVHIGLESPDLTAENIQDARGRMGEAADQLEAHPDYTPDAPHYEHVHDAIHYLRNPL